MGRRRKSDVQEPEQGENNDFTEPAAPEMGEMWDKSRGIGAEEFVDDPVPERMTGEEFAEMQEVSEEDARDAGVALEDPPTEEIDPETGDVVGHIDFSGGLADGDVELGDEDRPKEPDEDGQLAIDGIPAMADGDDTPTDPYEKYRGQEHRLTRRALERFADETEKIAKGAAGLTYTREAARMKGEAEYIRQYMIPELEKQTALELATPTESVDACRVIVLRAIERSKYLGEKDEDVARRVAQVMNMVVTRAIDAAYAFGVAAREQSGPVITVNAVQQALAQLDKDENAGAKND